MARKRYDKFMYACRATKDGPALRVRVGKRPARCADRKARALTGARQEERRVHERKRMALLKKALGGM